tara:strand:- start:57 stop:944 length:888 start_codon:yes stop_codon:yes gene_type:complete
MKNNEIKKHTNNQIVVSDGKYKLPTDIPVTQKCKDIFLSQKNFDKIKVIEDKNIVVNTLHQYINQTIMDKGVNMPPEEITYLKQRVSDDIMNHYTAYTLEEIRLALYYGVREEFGEYYGINAITIFKWLKSFRWELIPQTNLAMKKYLPSPDDRPKEVITKEQIDIENIGRCDSIFKIYKENNKYDFYDFGNVLYDWLDKRKLIDFTTEQKIDFKTESKNKLKSKMMDKNYDLSKRGKGVQKIDLSKYFEEIDNGINKQGVSAVIIGAKRLALLSFFTKHLDKNLQEFNNFLKHK